MDFIVVEGVKPWDGRYEFDLAGRELTTREWGWIKRLSGYLPLTVEEGLSDPELIVVFAAIALHRAGKVESREVPDVFDRLSDAPFGSAITMETDVEEVAEEANPPPPSESSSSNGDTFGPDSTTNSETSAETRQLSGMPASGISTLPPARSET